MMVNRDEKKYALYRGTFRSAAIRFEDGRIRVEAKPNEDAVDKALRLFRSLEKVVKKTDG